MGKIKITPGPWFVDTIDTSDDEGRYNSYAVYTSDGKVIMDAMNSDAAEIHHEYTEYGSDRWDEQAKYNAHLIAAAPDMFHALNRTAEHLNSLNTAVVAYLTDRMSKEDFINRCIELSDGPERREVAAVANAALAKARGEA